ncbi:MAG: isoprenyl transferase [Planctomycetota bacterium]
MGDDGGTVLNGTGGERLKGEGPAAALRGELGDERVPRHIAVIMDGNGRWAAERGFPRVFGHRNGARSVRTAVRACADLGVEVLTLYSFSTENWSRPSDEVAALMRLCVAYCDGERQALADENVRVRVIGRRAGLPSEVLEALDRLVETTAASTGPTLCLAINYGARDEIVDAARALAEDARAGRIEPGAIDHAAFAGRLTTAGLPDPDLLIRTAGELRLSNYLLWQLSYAEIYVTDVLWPDFGEAELCVAVKSFAARRRRFGGLESEKPAGEAAGKSAGGLSLDGPDAC